MSDPPPQPAPVPPPAPGTLPEPPEFSGPEIPGNVINEHGVMTVVKDGLDCYEWARMEFSLEPLFEEEEPIAWLWPERIPLGLVTVIEGAVSVGKSPLVADIIARVTRGAPWPGRVQGPQLAGEVLLACGELGGWPKVTLPRLKRAGADLTRIARLEEIECRDPLVTNRERSLTCRPLSFPGDLPHVEYAIRARPGTRLVVIDPLAMYCPDAGAWRETLRKLHEIAARQNVAIVVVTGRGGRASVRSRFQVAADSRSDEVRALFNVLEDVDDDAGRFFAPARMSFCAMPEWLAFRIVGGRVVWEAPLAAPPEEALPPRPGKGRGAIFREVTEWMRTLLLKADVPVQTALDEAAGLGYSEMTVRRVREHLQVRTVQQEGRWWWTLRAEESKGSKRSKRSKSDTGPVPLPPLRKGGSGGVFTADRESKRSKRSKSNGSHVSARRAPDVSPGITPPVEPAPARRAKRRRDGARGKTPRQPAESSSRSDWRNFREAVLEELNIAEAQNGETMPGNLSFVVPPSGGTDHTGNGRHLSNGKHSSNGRHDANGDDDSNTRRPKPR